MTSKFNVDDNSGILYSSDEDDEEDEDQLDAELSSELKDLELDSLKNES